MRNERPKCILINSRQPSLTVCRPFAELYAKDQEAFFKDYVKAHLQLSELGAEWEVEPFTLDD